MFDKENSKALSNLSAGRQMKMFFRSRFLLGSLGIFHDSRKTTCTHVNDEFNSTNECKTKSICRHQPLGALASGQDLYGWRC